MPCHDVRQAVAALVTTFGGGYFSGRFVIYFKKGPLEMTDDQGDRLIGGGGEG